MSLKEDFQRAIAQAQKGKSAGSGIDRKPNYANPSETDIEIISKKIVGKTVFAKGSAEKEHDTAIILGVTWNEFYQKYMVKYKPTAFKNEGFNFYLEPEQVEKMVVSKNFTYEGGDFVLKEDFQRAIAQSQSGKSAASGVDNRISDFSIGSKENEEEATALLRGKEISWVTTYRDKKNLVGSSSGTILRVEADSRWEDGWRIYYGGFSPHYVFVPFDKLSSLIVKKKITITHNKYNKRTTRITLT